MVNRVALVGASSTGKTTVYELLKNKLDKYDFINVLLKLSLLLVAFT